MYADSINVSSTAGSSSSLAYLKNQLQSNVSRENYEWNELMQQQSEENSNIGGKQNECRNIESVTLNSVNEKNQEKCGEEQCYGIETLMNETEEGTRSNHLRNEMKSQPSTILSEVAKELVLHQCSNKAQNELENRLWEGVNPYVYNEFYDTPEKILNGIMSDLKKTEDWRVMKIHLKNALTLLVLIFFSSASLYCRSKLNHWKLFDRFVCLTPIYYYLRICKLSKYNSIAVEKSHSTDHLKTLNYF